MYEGNPGEIDFSVVRVSVRFELARDQVIMSGLYCVFSSLDFSVRGIKIKFLSSGLPSRPTITNKEFEVETSFTLTWQAPDDDGGDSNLKYRVEWRKKPVTEDTVAKEEDNIGDLSLKIEGLEGPAEYEFKVFAKNSEGDGEPDTRTFIVKQAPSKLNITYDWSCFTCQMWLA